MNLHIEFAEGQSHRHRHLIQSRIRQILPSHPFLTADLELPSRLSIQVAITENRITQIDFDAYESSSTVLLVLHEEYLFNLESRLGPTKPAMSSLKVGFSNLLLHEFGHFVDACLDAKFKYSPQLFPKTARENLIRTGLWCSYIDGRLGERAAYDLALRQNDAWEDSGVDPQIIRDAWEGAYSSYPKIIEEVKNQTTKGRFD